MLLYRGMREESDGLPQTGSSARLLGVRTGSSTTPDVTAVNPDDIVFPDQGGMSVAPHDPMYLAKHRRPASLSGTGQDPIWYIDSDDLEPDLQFRQDKVSHGVIEPKHPMTLQDFQEALARTRDRWKLHCK
jgi:hypothetical protein